MAAHDASCMGVVMDWKELGSSVAKAAPALGAALGGQIIGAFATAIAYWLGSSRGSAEKQRALEAR